MGDGEIHKVIKRERVEVIYKGVFELKKYYQFLHDWLLEEGFEAADHPSAADQFESFYWERKQASGLVDYNIWWRIKKTPDEQPTNWFVYYMNIDFLGLAIGKAEVMYEGKKVGAYKGELTTAMEPRIVLDPDHLWKDDARFLNKLAKTFQSRTYRKEIKYHKDQLDDLTFRLQEAIKDFLGLNTFGDYGDSFHPERGLGWK